MYYSGLVQTSVGGNSYCYNAQLGWYTQNLLGFRFGRHQTRGYCRILQAVGRRSDQVESSRPDWHSLGGVQRVAQMQGCVKGFDIRLHFCATCHNRLQSYPHLDIPLRIPPRIPARWYRGG
jgi:hypothetical protein